MAKTNPNPEMRFAGFSEDWRPSKLGDIGDVKMCKRIFNNQTSNNGDIPFYKIGTFGKKADAFISKELYQEFRNKYPFPKKGDILLSASGTLGRIVVFDGKPAYFQDSNIVWLNHNESKILNEFLYYIYGNITYESEGGTIQRLYNSIILNARFSFPESKDEQKLIGNFFENIDNLITEHQQKHVKLKSLKQAMLGKMFPKQGQLVPEIRFKGFEGDWEEKKLSELSNYSNGKGYESFQSKTGKYELINLNSISIDGGLKPSGKFINHADTTLKENDLVMILSDVGHGDLLGRVALIPADDKYVLNQRFSIDSESLPQQ
jgi:type I restriction enzyme S subunit